MPFLSGGFIILIIPKEHKGMNIKRRHQRFQGAQMSHFLERRTGPCPMDRWASTTLPLSWIYQHLSLFDSTHVKLTIPPIISWWVQPGAVKISHLSLCFLTIPSVISKNWIEEKNYSKNIRLSQHARSATLRQLSAWMPSTQLQAHWNRKRNDPFSAGAQRNTRKVWKKKWPIPCGCTKEC